MIGYIARRIATWSLLVFVAVNLTYFIATAFLDPRSNYAVRKPPLPPDVVDATLSSYNLNEKTPILERWWTWLTNILLHWDWGSSPVGVSVNDQIAYRAGVSAQLVFGATVLATVIGVGLGVYTAMRQYRVSDRVTQAISIFLLNIPVAVIGLAVVLIGITVNQTTGQSIFFVSGARSIDVDGFWPTVLDRLKHLILPTITLVIAQYAGLHFLQRSLLLDTIDADYVRTARAKGLTRGQAVRKHALRTAIIPVAVGIAFAVPAIFTGAVITETIFGWEGMGRYFVTSINTNDIHGAVAVAAFGALATAIGAILADVAVVVLDPRVRVNR
ncbi:putative ABC transporter permease protein [Gordonia araii NBRC 100433]|uniref:Putative ABC transporter permease protein n=1 Tax=Gordonia araii NBRC 100433 TaxID=1073574 RepID=G7GYG3_9ACTN|nr:ABC transporter permease [Gordonia araii]NNG97365.1 ABC transporter permease [Gordonia araii NBRC 100433]GAB08638.1 putative ABC transporter permease protein [Gordonia araii NBRC 100433]